MKKGMRIVLVLCGGILVGIGALGIFLPVLPTTPFILLASFCFSSSSPRIHAYLRANRFFGPYIERYEGGAPVSRQTTIKATIFVWAGLLISTFMMKKLWAAIMFMVIGIGVSIHLDALSRRPGKKKAASGETASSETEKESEAGKKQEA